MRNLEIVNKPGGGITLKARVKHGPGDLHTIDLSADDVAAIGQLGFGPQRNRAPHNVELGIETLDSELIDMRKHSREWTATDIVAGDDDCMGGEAYEECLKGI